MSDSDDQGGGRRGHGQRRRAGREAPVRRSGGTASSGGGDRPPRRSGPPRSGPPRGGSGFDDGAKPQPLPEAAKPARELLETILGKMGLSDVEIVYIPRSEGEYFEVRGKLLANLIGKNGQTLEALNLVYNNILNAGVRNGRRYYTIDAEGYRARKADQLKTLALAALERVVREGKPYKLDAMLPSERKIVHLALSESPHVRTESEGVDPDRRLVVFPKDAAAE